MKSRIFLLIILATASAWAIHACAFEDKKDPEAAKEAAEASGEGSESEGGEGSAGGAGGTPEAAGNAKLPSDENINEEGELLDETPKSDFVKVVSPQSWITDDSKTPYAVHLTWRRNPAKTITVQWATKFRDEKRYVPKVWFVKASDAESQGGDMPMALQAVMEGTGYTYKETMNGTVVGRGEYTQWIVELAGLEPDTRYFYRCGTFKDFDMEKGEFAEPDLSDIHEFTTGPEKDTGAQFTILAAGDSRGGYDGIRANIERLKKMNPDFWLFTGDMNDQGNQKEWDTWFGAMTPVLLNTVLMPVQGNHETLADLYYNQFALPLADQLPEAWQEHGWSIDYGNMHIVALDSNTDASAEAMIPFLEADLKAARADPDIVWIAAFFHHPIYSASNHGSTTRLQDHWLPILEKYQVDLTIAGHDHNYERTHYIRGDQVVGAGEGVLHMVAGGFYSPGYSNGKDWWTVTSSHGDKSDYAWIEVNGKSLKVTAYSGDGSTVLDEFTMKK